MTDNPLYGKLLLEIELSLKADDLVLGGDKLSAEALAQKARFILDSIWPEIAEQLGRAEVTGYVTALNRVRTGEVKVTLDG